MSSFILIIVLVRLVASLDGIGYVLPFNDELTVLLRNISALCWGGTLWRLAYFDIVICPF